MSNYQAPCPPTPALATYLTTLHMSQVHIVHVNPAFHDSDWLSLLLCGLHELNEGDRLPYKAAINEQADSSSDSDPVAWYAPVLDSLACLLIYQPRHQAVSITVLPPAPLLDRLKPAKFLLAQTALNVPSDVRNQLTRIVGHIRRVRLLYVEHRPSGSS
ncbi:hypothetical protein OH76DRAFT_887441 [Lentinus brumalis]|uniref:Uncharacterized protein n=1 Tax=Lentinus brumalis TaxID=2498619 RepID=A0A371D1E9_9APHY|nr:hypothetical protein OH76DRAFT_887441 [Polyporus brumalis]